MQAVKRDRAAKMLFWRAFCVQCFKNGGTDELEAKRFDYISHFIKDVLKIHCFG